MQSYEYFNDVQKSTGATRQRISRKNLGQITSQLRNFRAKINHKKIDAAFAKLKII